MFAPMTSFEPPSIQNVSFACLTLYPLGHEALLIIIRTYLNIWIKPLMGALRLRNVMMDPANLATAHGALKLTKEVR